jgi:hypothetical protein
MQLLLFLLWVVALHFISVNFTPNKILSKKLKYRRYSLPYVRVHEYSVNNKKEFIAKAFDEKKYLLFQVVFLLEHDHP